MTAAALPPRADRKAYYAAMDAWRTAELRHSLAGRRKAWLFAGAAVVVALAQTAALVLLQPLTSPVLIGVETERTAGPAQARQGLVRGPLSADPALLQTEIGRYVVRRESLDPATFAFDHRAVVLASAGEARSAYVAAWSRGGPRLADVDVATRIVARVTGVTITGPGAAVARYEAVRCQGVGPCAPSGGGEVRIAFALSEAPVGPRDRLANPLGLVVTEYQR